MESIFLNCNGLTLISRMKKEKKTFSYYVTNSSGGIIYDNKKIIFGDKWVKEEFMLYNKTKKELKKHGELPPPEDKIDYIGITPISEYYKIFTDVGSIDINSAYHSAAHILGFFSDELYQEYKQATKKIRLRTFGATASGKNWVHIQNGIISSIDPEKENNLKGYFFYAAKYVAECMESIKRELKNDFYFYWVDCVFFKNTPENRQKVKEILTQYLFEFHDSSTDWVIYENKGRHFSLTRCAEGREKKYLFTNKEYYVNLRNNLKL